MAGHNLKSLSITNLDAVPIVPNTIGEGAPGFLSVITDSVVTVSGDDNTSTYRLLRFPTNAKVKDLKIWSAIVTAGSADIDIAFSDSLTDGTPPSLSSLTNPVVQLTGPVDNKLFGAAKSIVGAAPGPTATITSIIDPFQGAFTPAMANIPMWSNLVTLGATQFTADPGGFFDLYIKVTTAITTGGVLYAKMEYVE